jgi:hypothetical protein
VCGHWFSALPLALIWEKRLLLGSIRFEFLLVIFGIGNQFRSLLLTEFFFCVFLNGCEPISFACPKIRRERIFTQAPKG